MFTGIIEVLGKVEQIVKEGTNVHYTLSCPLSNEFKIDQSVSHNGVCLTVVSLTEGQHTVTAIEETLNRTNIGKLKVGQRTYTCGQRISLYQWSKSYSC